MARPRPIPTRGFFKHSCERHSGFLIGAPTGEKPESTGDRFHSINQLIEVGGGFIHHINGFQLGFLCQRIEAAVEVGVGRFGRKGLGLTGIADQNERQVLMLTKRVV